MQQQLDKYIDNNKMFHFEGERGVRHMEQIMREVCGYTSDWGGIMRNFFADNPGATEAVVSWVGEQNNAEWKANLDQLTGPADEEAEEEADWLEP